MYMRPVALAARYLAQLTDEVTADSAVPSLSQSLRERMRLSASAEVTLVRVHRHAPVDVHL